MADLFTPAELLRYSRHLLIPQVGTEGQARLKRASVLLIGAGGLGSPAALYLAAAGVGRLGIVDADTVDASNLQRQILHGEAGLGSSKVDSAIRRLHDLNPHVEVVPHRTRLTPENALAVAADYDVLVDGCDNFPTRFLSNDTAFFLRKPLVFGAIQRFEGQMTVFAPHQGGPCYRCMVPTLPPPGSVPSCADAGVLGVLPGVIGSLQAMETLKILLEIGRPPLGRLLCYDALQSDFRSIRLVRDPQCRLCGADPQIRGISNPETTGTAACGAIPGNDNAITAAELRAMLANGSGGVLLDVREPFEHLLARIPEARLIPLRELPDALPSLPHDRDLYVICRVGDRSAQAVELLRKHGFSRARNVLGGMTAWREAGAGH